MTVGDGASGPPTDDHGRQAAGAPDWLRELADKGRRPEVQAPWARMLPPTGQPGQRQSAVLLLFAGAQGADAAGQDRAGHEMAGRDMTGRAAPGQTTAGGAVAAQETTAGPAGVSIMLTERAHTLRSHPGQVSFPGGRAEPFDTDLTATALRETEEEVGVEPSSVAVAGVLPPLNLVVSSHDVSPVLGWWHRPGRAWVRDPREVARVLQVPIRDLTDPDHRFRVGHPGGWVGPAFQAEDLVVWGFTAMVLDGILRLAGWEVPWDQADVRPVP